MGSATLLRTPPGFVESYVCERTGGESRHNMTTSAVWKDKEAFQNARKNTAEAFRKMGFKPAVIRKNLNVETEGAVYRRSSY
jgi:hypothetical protein